MNYRILLCLAFLLVGCSTSKESPTQVTVAKVLPAGWDAKAEADRVMADLIKVTTPQVKGAHDSHLAIVGNRAFVISEVNDRQAGEAAGWAFIYVSLSIVDLRTLLVLDTMTVARSEQAFTNETLPVGACFVPRVKQVGPQTLRCYFASEQPGRRQSQTYYRDLDLRTLVFENEIHRLKLQTAEGVFDLQPQHLYAEAAKQGFKRKPVDAGLYLFDNFKQLDGQTYIAINNYLGAQQALCTINAAADTLTIVGHFNGPGEPALTEPAVNRLPDGSWLAISRKENGDQNYWFSESKNGKAWTTGGEKDFVKNGAASKPTFDKFKGLYYLGWQERATIDKVGRSIFNIDVSADGKHWERKYRFESTKSFQYPTFVQDQGSIWLCVTQGDSDPSRKERIMFGKLE